LIARGSALLFNIDVRHNFLTPYFSQSPSEFWTRWHISLSQWLRDYLYVPLGGNRGGRLQTLRNLVITMALGGLWHGAGIFFLFWGLWHGLLLVIYRLVPIDEYLRRFLGRYVGSTVAVILFFHLVCFGWILFRATPSDFPIIWHSIMAIPHMTHVDIHPFPYTLLTYYGYLVFVFAAAVMVTDAIGYAIGAEFPDIWTRAAVPFQVIMVLAAVYGIIFFGARQSNAFIYFAF
jgi:alginate O-acetyltransferase complex protein AlgI